MHAIFYSIRRADLRCLTLQRELLADYALTPARYLMLLVVLKANGIQQKELPGELGVTSMTVSRMVHSLVEYGFLEQKECAEDGRTYDLDLTRVARIILARIRKDLIEPGIVWGVVYGILRKPNEHHGDGELPGRLKFLADQLRTGLREYARFELDWCDRTNFPERYNDATRAVDMANIVLEEVLGPKLSAFP